MSKSRETIADWLSEAAKLVFPVLSCIMDMLTDSSAKPTREVVSYTTWLVDNLAFSVRTAVGETMSSCSRYCSVNGVQLTSIPHNSLSLAWIWRLKHQEKVQINIAVLLHKIKQCIKPSILARVSKQANLPHESYILVK